MKTIRLRHSTFLIAFFFFILSLAPLSAQEKKGKKILIKNADKAIFQKSVGRNRLLGNVVFEHDGALMYCDSAWLYSETNRIKAYENVRLNQGDTLFLTGDYLEYSGNTKLAKVTGKEVRLRDPQMNLVTTRLDLDRNSDLAYYAVGGTITDKENILVSKKGFYNTQAKVFNFKDSVVLTNPDYVIESDTLIYHSNSRTSFFHGPTTITSDSSFIYCENGIYNTILDVAQFEKNAYLYDENKYLTGDSLYYEKKDEYGEAYGCVFIHDTVENYVITGDYGEYKGSTDSAFVTLDPVYSVVQDADTLHIHGDTLLSTIRKDSLQSYRLVQVFHGVKFFKSDMQGMCDSLTYATLDSMFRMYYNPIVWNDSNQITGDTIYLTLKNDKLDSLKVYSNSFILSHIESDKHNQIKGRKMFGKFYDNKLRRVLVNGNGQSIYYPKNDKEEYIGMNKSISSNILIKLKDSQVDEIGYLNKPDSKLYPMDKLPAADKQLEGFNPRFALRPKNKFEILE